MKPSIANCKTCHHRGGNTCYAHIEGGDGPRTIDTDVCTKHRSPMDAVSQRIVDVVRDANDSNTERMRDAE